MLRNTAPAQYAAIRSNRVSQGTNGRIKDRRHCQTRSVARHGFIVRRAEGHVARLEMLYVSQHAAPAECLLRLLDAKRAPFTAMQRDDYDWLPAFPGVLLPETNPRWSGAELDRLRTALGDGPLYYARCHWGVPVALSGAAYVQLALRKWQAPTQSWEEFVVERPKRFMASGSGEHSVDYGLFLDAKSIEYCIDRLLCLGVREGIFRERLDETRADALARAFFVLVGGFDVPLVDAELTREAVRQLQSYRNFAGRQISRLRRTRFGLASAKRRVVPATDEVRSADDVLTDLIVRDFAARGPDWLRRLVGEFTPGAAHRKLLERTLLDQEPLAQVARELKLGQRDANEVVERFLKYCLFSL